MVGNVKLVPGRRWRMRAHLEVGFAERELLDQVAEDPRNGLVQFKVGAKRDEWLVLGKSESGGM